MNQLRPPRNGYQSRVWKNTIRLASWGVGWVAATALMGLGPKFIWHKALWFTLLAVGLNVALGVGLILAHKIYIAELDELQRKVFLNALAITVGVAVIAGIPWSVMARYHLIPFHADIANLVLLMSLTYVVSVVYGNWRYR
jgi:hypothetical protein